jgi:hypothetical protein
MGGGSAFTEYSANVGMVYCVNLVVGFGSLTLPKAFADCGLFLSAFCLSVLCIFSYMSASWIIESMAIANLMRVLGNDGTQHGQHSDNREDGVEMVSFLHTAAEKVNEKEDAEGTGDQKGGAGNDELASFLHTAAKKANEKEDAECAGDQKDGAGDKVYFGEAPHPKKKVPYHPGLWRQAIESWEKYELGELGARTMGTYGDWGFHGTMLIYLFGDLAIYATMLPTALREFAGPVGNGVDDYLLWLTVFAVIAVPLSTLEIQQTKHLQIVYSLPFPRY